MNRRLLIFQDAIAGFCRRHRVRKLSLFGSVLRDDLGPGSDVDVLVEFEPEHVPGFIGLAGMELELAGLLGSRKVDLNTPLGLSRYFRDEVLAEAEVIYAEN
jgi:predicted nucleotidyltransferase